MSPEPLTSNQIVAIAREMAMAIKPPAKIFEALGITQERFEKEIEPMAFYQNAFKTFAVEWESVTSTNRRIAIQAAAAIEDVLPEIAKRMKDTKETLASVITTAQWFSKLSGAGDDRATQPQRESFKIILNLGAGNTIEHNETRTIEVVKETTGGLPALPSPAEGASAAIPENFERQGEPTAIRDKPKGEA